MQHRDALTECLGTAGQRWAVLSQFCLRDDAANCVSDIVLSWTVTGC